MNVVNKFFLAMVLLPGGFYNRMGVNTFHLRSILNTRLIMDDRRPNTFHQTQQKKQDKAISAATLGTMLMSALMGCFLLIGFVVGNNYVTHLTIYFAMFIFMLASTLITDFTSVLIDVRDNYIILPKPVNDRTVVVARLLHITIHITKLVIPMCLPGVIFTGINVNGWGAFVLFLLVILITLFTIFLINAVYIFILKVTTPQKFQSVISYFQIFVAVFIFGGYQLVPRMIDKVTMQNYDITSGYFIWLAPPYWFAGAWHLLAKFQVLPSYIIAAIISLIVPFLSIWLVVKYFAPSFNQKLSQIAASGGETAPLDKAKKVNSTTSSYVSTLASIFTKKGSEHMAFLFCWKMTGRSKDFRMKIYPGIGYLVVYLVVMLLNSKSMSLAAFQQQNTHGKILLLSVVYFGSFMLITVINQISYSEKFKAAWIYFTTPIKAPGELITGALKAAIIKFYIPIIVLVSIPAVFLTGIKVIPNLALGLFNDLLICSLIAYINIKQLPFSASQNNENKGGQFIRGIFTLLVPAIFGFAHYLIYDFIWVVIILAVLSVIAAWVVLGTIKDTPWQKVQVAYEE